MTERNKRRIAALEDAKHTIRAWRSQYGERSMTGIEASAGMMVRLTQSARPSDNETWRATIEQAKNIVREAIHREPAAIGRMFAQRAVRELDSEILRTRRERAA